MKLPFAHDWEFDGVWYECSKCGDTTFGPNSVTTYMPTAYGEGKEVGQATITTNKPPRWHNGGSQGDTFFCGWPIIL